MRALEPVIKCSCGAIKDWEVQLEKTRLIQFLMGLHTSYTAARGHILMMNPWPFVNQAYMLIKQEEKQRQTHSSGIPISMMVRATSGNKFNDKSVGTGGAIFECSHCHAKGHTKERCYKLVGYPVDHPLHPNNKGKRRLVHNRFQQNSQNTGATKDNQAMQVSSVSGYNSSVTQTQMQTQMEALQNHMQTLMQCFSKDKVSSSGASPQYSFSSNIAGTIFYCNSTLQLP